MTLPSIKKSKLAFLNVFLFSLFWALQILVSKMGFSAGAKAIPFTLQSAVVALIFLSVVVLPKNYKEIVSLPKKVLLGLLLANAIHFGLGGFFSNSGVALTSAVNAGFLVKFALVDDDYSGLDLPQRKNDLGQSSCCLNHGFWQLSDFHQRPTHRPSNWRSLDYFGLSLLVHGQYFS